MTPEAAFWPATAAKQIAKTTGTVTTAASQALPLTRVPMTSVDPSTTGSVRETEPAMPLYEEISRRQMTAPSLALMAEM